jgi:hypothetical protein
VAITRQPYVFESPLRPFDDAESVHRDKHPGPGGYGLQGGPLIGKKG